MEGFGYVEFPQVSPDGETLVFNVVHNYTTSQLMVTDTKGGKVRALATGEKVDADSVGEYLDTQEGAIQEQATFSRDGRALYYRDNQNRTFDIGRRDLATGESRLVVTNPELNMKHPFEMKDGRLVCYGGPPGEEFPTTDRYSNIFLADPTTGSTTAVTDSKGEVAYKHPAEVDGAIVAHVEDKAKDGISDLVLLDPESGDHTWITRTPLADEKHAFVNDEVGLLVYHRKEDGDKNLVLSTPDGERSAQLTFYGRPAQSPCWSPDGKKIYFVKKDVKPEGDLPFFHRQAEIRVLDVKDALKDLAKQAKVRLKELEKEQAPAEVVELAQEQLDNYEYFLRRYSD